MSYDFQTRNLNRWEFIPSKNHEEWEGTFDNMEIKWNVKHQCGAYIIDGSLSLIHDWETLEDIMSQTEVY